MKINTKVHQPKTEEGAKAATQTTMQQLERAVLSCLLWENTFYESGIDIAKRIEHLCSEVGTLKILQLADKAFTQYQLRHIPLFLLVQALKSCNNGAAPYIEKICTRPDQMTELLSLYWKNGKKPLPKQLKLGLAKAFNKFDEYQLSKWNKDSPIKLKDVLALCHAKPKDADQDALWKRLIKGELATAQTANVMLSSKENRLEGYRKLITERKLPKLATLLNAKEMFDAGITKDEFSNHLLEQSRPMLPFNYLRAATMCPLWEDVIEKSMLQDIRQLPKLPGNTLVLIDVSGSMRGAMAGKSKTSRHDVAAAFAMMLHEMCDKSVIATFADQLMFIKPRSGFALRDEIIRAPSGGTYLGQAIQASYHPLYNRIVVVTDEQTHDNIPNVDYANKYIIDIAPSKNSVQTDSKWIKVNGFSEASLRFIIEYEKLDNPDYDKIYNGQYFERTED